MRIELLAPAKDLECGIAAVDSGADAVYIGAPAFSARTAASNPVRDIERLCSHAHKYFCRVYLCLNTLLSDDELAKAVRLGRECADAGVDAFIIQDMGLIEAGLTSLPLIASTQCHNTTPEKVLFLEKAGFSRVILGRELSLAEIRKIRQATKVELECFIHGSLCWSYSGRCWLSYSMGGRSGNRGECGQPCRLSWSLTGGTGKLIRDSHLFSLKDLNLTDRLEGMLDAGISSFKIEGRLKGPDYVRNITAHYRKTLDCLLDGKRFVRSSSGTFAAGFVPDPSKTFNRGYTRYFIDGRRDCENFSRDTPKMKGEFIGRADTIRGNRIRITAGSGLRPGDGLCWFDRDGGLTGSTVEKVDEHGVAVRNAAGLSTGTPIYRNYDSLFMQKLEKAAPARTIPVRWKIAAAGEGLSVSVVDGDGIAADAGLGADDFQPAENSVKARIAWEAAFGKLGGTEFRSEGVLFSGIDPPFVPVSVLNRLRRSLIESLRKSRLEARPPMVREKEDPSWPYPEGELDFEAGVLNSPAEKFYRKHGVTKIERAPESGLADMSGRRIARSRACPLRELELCGYKGNLYVVDPKGRKFELRPDCEKCEISVFKPDPKTGQY